MLLRVDFCKFISVFFKIFDNIELDVYASYKFSCIGFLIAKPVNSYDSCKVTLLLVYLLKIDLKFQILMNVQKCHITVMPMQPVQILMDPTPALVMMDGQVMDLLVQVGII